jgi:antitoxin component YwqK of YwqJK toxin-antitoxin module
MNESGTLHIAEIPYESGAIQYRYARYLSDDGSRWIRHGLFCAFWENGNIKSEGEYAHGAESGLWSDYHENGQLAAQGPYINGKQHGLWRFLDSDGREEESAQYHEGEEIA